MLGLRVQNYSLTEIEITIIMVGNLTEITII